MFRMGEIKVDEKEFNKYKKYYDAQKKYNQTERAKAKQRERAKIYYEKNKDKKQLLNKINYYKKKDNQDQIEKLKNKLKELSSNF